jgi:Fe-S cluster biogenesis protein NfuA
MNLSGDNMAIFGIRNKLKTFIKDALQLSEEDSSEQSVYTEPPAEPVYQAPEETTVSESEQVLEQEVQPVEETQEKEEAPAQAAPAASGRDLTPEEVQEVLDDDVRPALQMDGGDIELVKVEDDNIYVRLVGACSTCPSSVMTMRMGVENLLREEFPSLKELIEVNDEAQEAPQEA